MAQLRSPNFDARLPRKRCHDQRQSSVLSATAGMSVRSQTHLSRKRKFASVSLIAVNFSSSRRVFSSRLRLRLGALSKKWMFGDQTLKRRLLSFFFSQTEASLRVFPLLYSRARVEANFEVIFWQPASSVGLSVLGMAPCVWGDCAVCELTPKQRFSPLLSAATRMYHHVTVQWIVLRLQCEHPDLTSHHIISHSS